MFLISSGGRLSICSLVNVISYLYLHYSYKFLILLLTIYFTKGWKTSFFEMPQLLIDLVKGFRLTAYRCAGIWTIGYGHTGNDVCKGVDYNREDSE
ncbi:glycoside hydrolase family protein [Candidatus Liberibacter solanacearum]|uniref:glycoside hydrolase family protein n=1 Tax=Candidatus Liberibacter solanacearum TaxID=556287 RepID=UPI003CCAD7BD